ncbi:MAG: tRNA (guanosine(46)-N7)-methyltransferase TrmB [Flavobacteriales bacterium]
MGRKSKLRRFAEVRGFTNVVEPHLQDVFGMDFHLKGKWSSSFFQNDHPLMLELACGKAEYSLGLARIFPGINFIGMDIKGARIWRGAKTALEERLHNVAFIRSRIEFVQSFFASREVAGIWIPFPDPQPRKSRAHKRLTSPPFLEKYSTFISPGGDIHLKTDDHGLHVYTLDVIGDMGCELCYASEDIYADSHETLSAKEREALFTTTFYEKMHLAEGRKITYIKFRLPQ